MVNTAIILAGGLGTRLRTVLKDRPKVLAPVAGRPFIQYVLSYLARQSINQIIISVGYQAEKVISFIEESLQWHQKQASKMNIRYVKEEKPLGTGGAISLASRNLMEPFIALNGDTLFLINLHHLIEFHAASNRLATIALLHSRNAVARGCVHLDEHNRIIEFVEKPSGNAGHSIINGGVYILSPEIFYKYPTDRAFSLEKQVFPELALQGQLSGYIQEAYFIDIGTPESLQQFEQDVVEGKLWELEV